MMRATIAGAFVLIFLALFAAYWIRERSVDHEPSRKTNPSITPLESQADPGFLYGRLITHDGVIYQGRLRWGGVEEAFWSDYFNGFKGENPWIVHVAPEQLKERRPLEIFGFEIVQRELQIELGRPFMARFGDILRIEAQGRDLRVTLKSGTVFHLDRFAADDFADGVRIWDVKQGVLDFNERRIRSIELLHSNRFGNISKRLHGTVRTRRGEFTGFVQWDREGCLGSDELEGFNTVGEIRLRFENIRSIARHSSNSSRITALDGSQIILSGTSAVGQDHRGIYVDDLRYGRVLVPWAAFERVDFTPGGSSPVYDDFPPGKPLMGTVITLEGRRLTGRLIYDLDESETTETLDAPAQGVNFTIPFGLISAIVSTNDEKEKPHYARVILHSGEELLLERKGDLDRGNGGMLIFNNGDEGAEYVPWNNVAQVQFDRPPAMYPPLRER